MVGAMLDFSSHEIYYRVLWVDEGMYYSTHSRHKCPVWVEMSATKGRNFYPYEPQILLMGRKHEKGMSDFPPISYKRILVGR